MSWSHYLIMTTGHGHIEQVAQVAGVRWALPFNLYVFNGFGWQFVGRFETEGKARAAARRRGIRLAPRRRSAAEKVAARRRRLMAEVG